MPKTTAEVAKELARLSSDCSFLLTHLIRQNDEKSDADAKNILSLILDLSGAPSHPLLKASSSGWYGTASPNIFNPATRDFDGLINNKAVCFTESTLAGLKAHRDVFNAKYGVAFDRDFLFTRGANPCLNVRESLLKASFTCNGEIYPRSVFNFIPHQLHPFVNIIHESFDATHEREWRVPGDLAFTPNELLFVFCPADDFAHFASIQSVAKPVLFDLAWLDRV
ncbi:MAG: hypothetical protein ACK4S6_07360 [Roseateles asaccharophilus]|uniref:Uncharacterized protein n=1 Tax=Roseateles asaccharophilus TaxID=582607 RepID=A0A4R6N9X5_9BURK|nr:hypothetical protein [Roseateles asaccharophilus]MDN3543567.1 hypothetical protein [Roseateles asaccharophilus]TDP12057.1 hypothetical protein DFR39_102445 [Roseateles asaccharophilus]